MTGVSEHIMTGGDGKKRFFIMKCTECGYRQVTWLNVQQFEGIGYGPEEVAICKECGTLTMNLIAGDMFGSNGGEKWM